LAFVLVLSAVIALPQGASAGLFSFATHTFTPCGSTGINGPTTANCTSAYSAATWSSNASYYTTSSGKQIFTIPNAGVYRVTVAGAAGGTGATYSAGNGAVLQAEFTFTQGTSLTLLVGQMGLTGRQSAGVGGGGGGGGGSFLYNSTSSTLLMAAGGGGGGAKQSAGLDATTAVNGIAGRNGSTGGTLNAGGTAISTYNAYYGAGGGGANSGDGSSGSGGGGLGGGGGAGYTGNGGIGNNNSIYSYSFKNGGVGSYHTYSTYGSTTQAAGGFGGGGNGSIYDYLAGGGGGGGYTGGGGGNGYGSDANAGGGGGGGGSFISGSNQTSSVTNASQGYITITLIAPAVTSFAPRGTITNSSTIVYDLVFSEAVTDLTSADFSLTGTGSGTCTVNSPVGSLSNYTISVTGCSQGTVLLTLASGSVISASSQSGPGSASTASTVTIDQTAPTISAVTAPANGSYKPADTPTFSVQFSESVTITGTPRLVLTVGTTTKYATYLSKSDSRTALFRYTVGASTSEFDSDGITLATELDLNSGTIVDSANNALVIVTLTPPTLSSVLIVQPPAPPSIDSIAATSAQLAVYFAPSTTYGSSVTNYQYSTNNGSTWTTRSPVATTSPILITGLTNNTAYPVRLRAISAAGNSDSSSAVTGTPTLIVVSGDATLTTTFGSAASTGTYSATGGTGPYAFSISSTANGLSISGGVVTVSASTSAGTYARDVIATDSLSQTGAKQLTITVRKASSTISLALQGGGTDSPVGQAPVLLITTSLAGSVDFLIGGGSLSGCTAIAIASTSGSCTLPTPPSTGSVTVTAVLTPTASGNYETSTATFTLTIVDGVSTISISLAGGVTQAQKGKAIVITATINQAGKVTFMADGKRIPKCYNLSATVGNKTCSWTPSIQKQVSLAASLTPTNSVYRSSNSSLIVQVIRRTGTR
jgi:hypothetical protein